eukprot:1930089-Pyramimonas_sp.AAC.1
MTSEMEMVREDPPPPSIEDLTLSRLRGSYAFAQVCHFCRIFAVALRMKSVSADHLEQCLLYPAANNRLTAELLYKLVRPDAQAVWSDAEAEFKWHDMVVNKVKAQFADFWEEDPLSTDSYYDIDALERVKIWLALCEWRLGECGEVKDSIKASVDNKEFTADCLRREPIGVDAQGRRYFHFATEGEDCRLYRETPAVVAAGKVFKLKSESRWETVCVTLEDVQQLLADLQKSKSRAEKALSRVLESEVLK